MNSSFLRPAAGRLLCVVALLAGGPAFSTTLVTQLDALTSGAPVAEVDFTPTSTQAGSIEVSVTDNAVPAALAAVRVAVTTGTTVVSTASADGGTPLTVKVTFNATAGTAYAIRIVGRPSGRFGTGSVTVSAVAAGTTAPVFFTQAASFQTPIPAAAGGALPDQTVTFPEAGTYTATLADLALPSSLQALNVALCLPPCTDPQSYIPLVPGTGAAPGTTPITIQTAGTAYTLKTIAVPGAGASGGLFRLQITGGPSSTRVFPQASGESGVTAIGSTQGPIPIKHPSAGAVALQVTDTQLPTALTTLGAVLTDGTGQLVARQCVTACGAADVLAGMAAAGDLLLWRNAAAGASPGAYVLGVTASGSVLYSDSKSVSPASSSAPSASSYDFPFNVGATGNYLVTVTDLAAPANLASVQFAVLQNGVTVGTPSALPGNATVPLQAGSADLVVVAQAPAGGSGIFGYQVATTDAVPKSILANAQAVGQFSGSVFLPVISSQAGQYDVTLTDAGWPATFQTLNVFITNGASIVGKIYGGGNVSLNLPAGNYLLTYSAVVDPVETAGLYGLNVQSSVPTVSLTSDSASVPSGQGVRLSWTSTGATSCAASGGWSGTQPTSGTSVAEGPLSADTTFTLTCSGPGGTSAPSSVKITVTAAASGSGGGGGGMSVADVALLATLALVLGRTRARHLRRRLVA